MLDQFVALMIVQRLSDTESLSARPAAPVIADAHPRTAVPRTYRSRAAIATRLARLAELVAPIGWVPSHRTAPSR
jgi:hypothetical protein